MAYDSESDRIIMYGGELERAWSGQVDYGTWAYDLGNNLWAQMQAEGGPETTYGHGFAYDSESDRVIMCGGINVHDEIQTATWAYDYNTNTWTELSAGPEVGQGTRMVYDSESDRMILFGGWRSGHLNETWAYDFNADTWNNMEPDTSPSPRTWHNMVYDAESDRVIVWAGEPAATDPVWAYDYNSNAWTEHIPETSPSLLSVIRVGAMVYDGESGRAISFGGGHFQGPNTTDAIWVYDHNAVTWTEMTPDSGPGERTTHDLVYHSGLDRVVLFGGRIGAGLRHGADTWVYDLNTNTWTEMLTGETAVTDAPTTGSVEQVLDAETGLPLNPEVFPPGEFIIEGRIRSVNTMNPDEPMFIVEAEGRAYVVFPQPLSEIEMDDGTALRPHEFRSGMIARATIIALREDGNWAPVELISEDMVILAENE